MEICLEETCPEIKWNIQYEKLINTMYDKLTNIWYRLSSVEDPDSKEIQNAVDNLLSAIEKEMGWEETGSLECRDDESVYTAYCSVHGVRIFRPIKKSIEVGEFNCEEDCWIPAFKIRPYRRGEAKA